MDKYEFYISGIEEILRDRKGGMTISDLAPALQMSRNTIGKYLEIMYLSGIVDIRTYGRSRYYYLSPRVPVTSLLNYLPDAVVQTDEQYRIVHANLPACDMLGSDDRDFTGRHLLDLLGILGMSAEIRSLITNPDRDVAISVEILLSPHGTARHLLVTIADMVMYDGMCGHIFILEDITGLKAAEEGKRVFEYLFTTLAGESWERICLLTPDCAVTYGNRQFFTAGGRDPDLPPVRSVLEPYDSRTAQTIRDAVSHAAVSQVPSRQVLQVPRSEGQEWLDMRLFPVPGPFGADQTIAMISRDVTGLQEGGNASALLSVLLRTMTEGVLTVTVGGTILSWNRGAEQITGYPAEELLGGTAQTIIAPELNGGRDVIIDAVRGDLVEDLRMTIRAKGGRKRKVILSTAIVPDHTGMIAQVILVWREP